MQDEIVSRLANQLRAELDRGRGRAGRARAEPRCARLLFPRRRRLQQGSARERRCGRRTCSNRRSKLNPAHVDAHRRGGARRRPRSRSTAMTERAERLKAAEAELLKALVDRSAQPLGAPVARLCPGADQSRGSAESASSSGRCRSTATSASRMPGRASPRSCSAARRRPRRISPRLSASRRSTASRSCGNTSPGSPSFTSERDAEAAESLPPVDRRQPEFSAEPFPQRRGARAARPAERGRGRGQGGARHCARFHAGRLPRGGRKRQSGLSRPARAGDRGHAQGRRSRKADRAPRITTFL